MRALGIREQDLVEKFIRSRGPGGQKTNKTSTCVYLKHPPSNIEIKCQRERSQALNRFLARRTLVEKLEALKHRQWLKEKEQALKLRHQKRKRSKATKERILREKRKRGEKKRLRSWRPAADEF